MQMNQIRTDLAVEERERISSSQQETRGIRVEEEHLDKEEIHITTVFIDTENGAKQMGKPKGVYITLEAEAMSRLEEQGQRAVSVELARLLQQLLPEKTDHARPLSILVAGLGNRMVTPDALGPQTVEHLCITRHMWREYGDYAYPNTNPACISSIVPGVMGQTGMESVEIIQGIVERIHPDALLVVDALAARSTRRLGRTIQITDAGIHPGSGVGNHRNRITKESLGIPVIAIGIPTVVEAVTIVTDSLNDLVAALSQDTPIQALTESWKELSEGEQMQLVRELISPQLNTMFVTPKDIDACMQQLSFTVAEGINLAFAPEQNRH